MKKFLIIILYALTFTSVCATAQQSKVVIDAVRTLQCDFTQTRSSKMMTKKMVSQGKMYFISPDKLRWEYTTPEKILLVVNGDRILYKKNNKKEVADVSKKKMFKKISQLLLLFVTGDFLKENRYFNSTVTEEHGDQIVTLIPKKGDVKQLYSKVILHIKNGLVDTVEMYEKKGATTIIEMSNIKKDETFKSALFDTGKE